MTPEELREKLKTVAARDVAEKTGLHYQSVYNFRHGLMPSMRTYEKLEKYAREWLK